MEIKEKGCVYFFRHIGLTPIKIGYSESSSPIDRFTQFKTYAPYGSEIIGFIQTYDAKEIESQLHRKYSSKRLKGEWFEISEQECNYEIEFHSSVEDIKARNEFQIAWALKMQKKPADINKLEFDPNLNDKKQAVIDLYNLKPNFNRSRFAKKLHCSRQFIISVVNDIDRTSDA